VNHLMARKRRAMLIAGCLLAAACSHPPEDTGGRVPPATTRLEVVNRSSSDMDIFVVRSGQRVRLGLAPNNTTTRFSLEPAQVAGVGLIRFEARPLAGLGRPVSSDPTMIGIGDSVRLDIPPP
jgi:hypothetical protein